ncbi:aldo/keto reductase [Kribbella sp. CWNU-51]
MLKLAAADRFGLIAYSPLAQGLLTDKYLDGRIPAGARAANSTFLSPEQIDDVYRERAAALNPIARDRGQSLAQLQRRELPHPPGAPEGALVPVSPEVSVAGFEADGVAEFLGGVGEVWVCAGV